MSESETERLRKLLEGRGVFYLSYPEDDQHTPRLCWKVDDDHDGYCYFFEDDFHATELLMTNLTPEQAIDATLGNERLAFLEEKVKRQGDYIVKLDKEKKALFAQNCEAATRHAGQMDCMARKLEAATLDRGTCKWKPADSITEGDWWDTECGESFTWEPYGTPNYCPNCGRKVVDE